METKASALAAAAVAAVAVMVVAVAVASAVNAVSAKRRDGGRKGKMATDLGKGKEGGRS